MTNMYNASQKQLRRKKRENFHARWTLNKESKTRNLFDS
jgi:hypothetical protein